MRALAIVTGAVTIGEGTVVGERSHIEAGEAGTTVIGRRCVIGPGAFVGTPAQHQKADHTVGHCVLGDDVTVRECVTINRASKPGIENATRVGDGCFLMACSHVGHDCVLEAEVTMANAVLLAGHVTVGRRAFLGGMAGFHQFVNVGRLAMVGGGEIATQDVPPFAAMRYGRLKGYNAVGCRRAGVSREGVVGIRAAFLQLRRHRVMSAALAAIRDEGLDAVPEVEELLAFIGRAKRGVVPSVGRSQSTADDQ